MQRKASAALLALIAGMAFLSWTAKKRISSSAKTKLSTARLTSLGGDEALGEDEVSLAASIPFALGEDEILLAALTADFDTDGEEDQGVALQKAGYACVFLAVALADMENETLVRLALAQSGVSSGSALSLSAFDLTGEGRTALVVQGSSLEGKSVFEAYTLSDDGALQRIADFKTEGSIYVRQLDKRDARGAEGETKEAFAIEVSELDPLDPDGKAQVAWVYEWDTELGHYVAAKAGDESTKSTSDEGKSLSSAEEFSLLLDGLWRKRGSDSRLLFFDTAKKETIFFLDGTQEVYRWLQNSFRRSGATLAGVNQEIENMQRKVDVVLSGENEIALRVQDDVKMNVSEGAVWDGTYHKATVGDESTRAEIFESELSSVFENEPSWREADGSSVRFADGSFEAQGQGFKESGFYFCFEEGGQSYVQFKQDKTGAKFSGVYKIISEQEGGDEQQLAASKIALQPCSIFAYGIASRENRPFVLTKEESFILNLRRF